jgi:hypothetical protein
MTASFEENVSSMARPACLRAVFTFVNDVMPNYTRERLTPAGHDVRDSMSEFAAF